MEEKTNDELNASIDSWEGEYDNKNNDITKLKPKEQIKKGCAGGKKYILYDNDNNKKFFAKQLADGNRAPQLLEIASSSAFISCFSHTPYPIGIKNIDGKDFIVLRFEKTTADIDEKTEELLRPFIDSFCTVHHRDLFINTLEHKKNWQSLLAKHKKYIIQLCVHQFFFSFFDRKYDNIIITDNGMHHIDTDLSGTGDWFMFSVNGHQDRYNKVKSFITFLHDISPNDKQLCNFFHTEIDKIKKIDYEKFVNRYIRNCIVLDITAQDAYSYLKDHVINKMYEFFQTTLEGCYDLEDENMQNNEYFKILKQGFTGMKNIIKNNDILNKIMSNDEGEKWFTNEFQQKEKELKSSFKTEEQKENNNNLVNNDQQPSSTLITGNGREENEVKKDNLLNNNIFDEHSSANKSENTYHIEKENKDNNNSVKDNQQLQNALIAQKHMLKLNNGNGNIQNNVESGSSNHGFTYYAKRCLSLCNCCRLCKNAGE